MSRGSSFCRARSAARPLVAALVAALVPAFAFGQTHAMPDGSAMGPHAVPFYQEGTFHALVGIVLAGGALVLYRVLRFRRRRRAVGPAGFVSEAVVAVDLVDSTFLATHYGEAVALRARNGLEERLAGATEGRATYRETTGDGCLATFVSVRAAVDAAIALLRGLRRHPPDIGERITLHVRIGITYGEILLDARGARHGAAINKAFRLLGVSSESFAEVKGEAPRSRLPARTRILVDEAVAQELGRETPLVSLGFARLKGFTGLHGVYELAWQNAGPAAQPRGHSAENARHPHRAVRQGGSQ